MRQNIIARCYKELRNKLESSIANISEDLPEFSLLTSSQLETIRHCKVSALEKSLQSTMEPDEMTKVMPENTGR